MYSSGFTKHKIHKRHTKNEQRESDYPTKYSLQISTCEAIIRYQEANNVSLRQSCFLAFSNLKKNKKVDCGFNIVSSHQFYSSFRRFKSSKMLAENCSEIRSP